MPDTQRPLDLITIGRSSVDLYGQQAGGRLEDMGSFENQHRAARPLELQRSEHESRNRGMTFGLCDMPAISLDK